MGCAGHEPASVMTAAAVHVINRFEFQMRVSETCAYLRNDINSSSLEIVEKPMTVSQSVATEALKM